MKTKKKKPQLILCNTLINISCVNEKGSGQQIEKHEYT